MRSSITLLKVALNKSIADWKYYLVLLAIPGVITFFQAFFEDFGDDANALTLSSILLGISVLSSLLATSALVFAGTNPTLSAQEAYTKSLQRFIPYLALTLGYSIIVVLGLILLILPGIYFGVIYAFSFYILLLENVSLSDALGRSKDLVKGRFWGVFVRLSVIILFTIAIYIVIKLITSVVSAPIGEDFQYALATLLGMVTLPISNLFMLELYSDLKGTSTQTDGQTAVQ